MHDLTLLAADGRALIGALRALVLSSPAAEARR
jgi:hypothetical protein